MSATKASIAARVIPSDEDAIRAAHEFADLLRPGAVARDAGPERPWSKVRELAASGLLGITVPREHGTDRRNGHREM